MSYNTSREKKVLEMKKIINTDSVLKISSQCQDNKVSVAVPVDSDPQEKVWPLLIQSLI